AGKGLRGNALPKLDRAGSAARKESGPADGSTPLPARRGPASGRRERRGRGRLDPSSVGGGVLSRSPSSGVPVVRTRGKSLCGTGEGRLRESRSGCGRLKPFADPGSAIRGS